MIEIKELKDDVAAVKKDTKYIRDSVQKINGRLGTVESKVRDFEEDSRRKELDCPYREVIIDLSETKLTEEALKKFVREQEEKRNEEQKARDLRLRWVVGAIGIVFTIITILVNVMLFYAQKNENTKKDSPVSAYDGRVDSDVLGVSACFVAGSPI